MKNTREIAYDILNNVFFQGCYSNIEINKSLRKHNLSNLDIGFLTELVYGTIERKLFLEYVFKKFLKMPIKKVSKEAYIVILMGIYQIRYMDSVTDFAAVDESVKLIKKKNKNLSGFVNGVLRNILRDKNSFEITEKDKIKKLSVKYSISTDIVKLILSQYKTDADRILSSMNNKPKIYARVNTMKITAEDLLEKFLSENVEGKIVNKNTILVKGIKGIENNELFKNGYFSIQDLSSIESILELDPKEGDSILDLCSAPGGKSTFIAELINDNGNIISRDVNETKIKFIQNYCDRLGIKSIKTEVGDATVLVKDYIEKFDKVIADLPCSGFGIVRKKPEIKYKQITEVRELYSIQTKILENAIKYTKKGGIVFYSTCTINKEENENQIKKFIESGAVSLISEKTCLFREDESDGFYYAKLKKL